MTNKSRRLGRLERVVDLELEARAREVIGLDGSSVNWAEFARGYKGISERLGAARRKHGKARPDMEREARRLAKDLDLDVEELMAEAESITIRSGLDPQAARWLLSRL